MNIRPATVLDISSIVHLLYKWADETRFQKFPMPNAEIGIWVAELVQNHLVIVGEIDGEVVGTIGLRFDHFPWNNKSKLLICEFLMLEKQHRSNGAAKKMLEYIKRASHEIQAPVMMGIMAGMGAIQKDRFLEMSGFEYAGGNFIYGGS